MLTLAVVLTVLASLLHVYIWYLESLAWTTTARKVFGTTAEEAEATREMAYNQGFYNLFLAITGLAGAIAVTTGHRTVGLTLIVVATASMAAAATVLLLTSPDKRSAAMRQGTLPFLALVALAVVILT